MRKCYLWFLLFVAGCGVAAFVMASDSDGSAPDFVAERKAMIGPIPPPPSGAITFDATQLNPLLQDDPDFKILPDTPIPGMCVARSGAPSAELIRMPDNDGSYWKLNGVPAGRYYVGIWYESSRNGLEAPQSIRGYMVAYLNGRALQLATHSEPVQVAPGIYYVEAQSKVAEPLKDGDEIAVLVPIWQPVRLARLVLHRDEPARGHGWIFENYGANMFARDSALRMNAFCGFRVAPGKRIWRGGMESQLDSPDCLEKTADGKALAYYQVANTLPVPLTVKCSVEVRSYFREIVGAEETILEVQPHERVTRELPFTLLQDSARYTMEVKVSAVNPPQLDWPVADTIDFFKGVRQSVPWPDPFNNEFRRSICFAQPAAGIRQKIALNDQWESAFTAIPTALPVPPPADLKWEPRQVPFVISGWNEKPVAHGLYAKRIFTAPEDYAKRTWRLLIKDVIDEATLYVNGQKLGNVRGCRTPLLCDITKALKPGDNEILIAVRDALANMDPKYVKAENPMPDREFLDAPGTGYACTFSVNGVELQSSPLVSAEDLIVMTSVRKQDITATFNLVNRENAPRTLKVKASVLDAGTPVMELGERVVELAPGSGKDLAFKQTWADPVFWGPGSPKLYTLAIEISEATSGRPLDLLRERFGFRECWIENGRIMLNGAPVRLKGSNCGGGGGLIGSDDVQWTRGSAGMEHYLDESGCLAGYYTLGGLGNTPSRHNVESDSYWEIETRNVIAGARQFINHPSLIAWDLSNEWLSFLMYGGGDVMFGARRFKAVGDALMELDPSRFILYDGDGDLYGLWDTLSEHYSNPYPSGQNMRGHSAYLPDSRFWRELDQDFTPGVPIPSGYQGNFHPDKTPMFNTENAWKVDGNQPPGFSTFLGEDDVLSPAIDSGRGAAVWFWKQIVDGHRDVGFSIVCNYTAVTGLNRRGHMLQCFIMPEHAHHYFSGARFLRGYSLHNDTFAPSQFDLRWALVDAKGRVVREGHEERSMDTGDIQRSEISFALPKVKERVLYTLRIDLYADGKFAYGEERDLGVYPDRAAAVTAPVRRIHLFDPRGETAGIFKKAGIPFTPAANLAVPDGDPSDTVLVIGENALPGDSDAAAGALGAFTAAGGRVVALMQEKQAPGLPVRTTLEPREWCSMLFLRTPQHPILKGLDSWDLQFWAPDHVVAKGSFSKPANGSFVALLDGAGDHDRASRSAMDWSQLLESYRGQGSYLICQLPLIEKYETEPMAREMLARIISYEGSAEPFRVPVKTVNVVAGAESSVASRLQEMGVRMEKVEPDATVDGSMTLLVDAATLLAGFTPPASWKSALEGGATLLIHGASPKQRPLLATLASRPVEMTVHPYAMWEGRGFRNGFTWLTPGLSHIDLYWKDYDGSEAAADQAETPKLRIEDLNTWAVSAEGAVEHIYPGALVEIPVGKGRLIVDQVRWETSNRKLQPLAERVVSSMMLGLNVALAPYEAPRSLAPGVIFKPVDLSALCNRGFIDEVGSDGKGGWPDQGPNCDMRQFPTGDLDFGGVPYKVGKEPNTCIVLKSSSRPLQDLYPDEVTIPIGGPVEGLYFLHSTSWGGQSPSHVYEIQYEDGTSEEILLVENENIFGWTRDGAAFPRERGTRSRVVWTGTTGIFPTLCVCEMLWVNSKPDVPVKAVRYANPLKGMCPVMIAVTAAVMPTEADLEAIAAGQLKAKEFLQKGLASFDAGKDAEAKEALEQAVKADPKLDAAHQRLCELAERSSDDEAILAAYKAWTVAGARTPLPYNKLGAILEKNGDDKGALDAYTKSIEVEWNQPPIIEAKSRLMLKLKK